MDNMPIIRTYVSEAIGMPTSATMLRWRDFSAAMGNLTQVKRRDLSMAIRHLVDCDVWSIGQWLPACTGRDLK